MFRGKRFNNIYQFPLIKTLLLVGILISIIQPAAMAQGTTGAVSLKHSFGARGMGMGEAFTGISDDISAIWYNPAGIAQIEKRQIGAMYLLGLEDSRFGFIGYVDSFSKKGMVGIGISAFQAGDMIIDDADEDKEGKVSAQDDYMILVSYAYPLYTRIADIKRGSSRYKGKKKVVDNQLLFGLTFKGLSSRLIEKYKATAFCGDFGLHWSFNQKRFGAGIVVQNVGGEIKYEDEGDPLPLSIRGGFSSRLMSSEEHRIIGAFDVVKEKDMDVRENVGVEYLYKKSFAVRMGYKFGYDLDSLAGGIGFIVKGFQLDYAFGLMGDLDPTHRISIMYSF